ncbi:hypothetical protein HanOQP8_Chr03g0086451 [Helianthus annuus]|nr:hypothetical protein HanOQP8_Chr03g0086451 [Helianthus annuus]
MSFLRQDYATIQRHEDTRITHSKRPHQNRSETFNLAMIFNSQFRFLRNFTIKFRVIYYLSENFILKLLWTLTNGLDSFPYLDEQVPTMFRE